MLSYAIFGWDLYYLTLVESGVIDIIVIYIIKVHLYIQLLAAHAIKVFLVNVYLYNRRVVSVKTKQLPIAIRDSKTYLSFE